MPQIQCFHFFQVQTSPWMFLGGGNGETLSFKDILTTPLQNGQQDLMAGLAAIQGTVQEVRTGVHFVVVSATV